MKYKLLKPFTLDCWRQERLRFLWLFQKYDLYQLPAMNLQVLPSHRKRLLSQWNVTKRIRGHKGPPLLIYEDIRQSKGKKNNCLKALLKHKQPGEWCRVLLNEKDIRDPIHRQEVERILKETTGKPSKVKGCRMCGNRPPRVYNLKRPATRQQATYVPQDRSLARVLPGDYVTSALNERAT